MFGKNNFFLEIQDHHLEQDKRLIPASQPPLRRNRHAPGRHQRLALPAPRRRPRARNPPLHPDRQDHERHVAHALEHAGFLSQIARRDDAALRGAGRFARPHLGNRAALPRQPGKDQGAVPEVRRPRRAYYRHVFRIRRAAGFRKPAAPPGSPARRRTPEARPAGLHGAPGSRDPHDPADEVLRLLPDRLGFHPLRQIEDHPGRAGPWFGCRQPGRLRDGHHRYRSAAVRTAVRALPESRSASACPISTSISA